MIGSQSIIVIAIAVVASCQGILLIFLLTRNRCYKKRRLAPSQAHTLKGLSPVSEWAVNTLRSKVTRIDPFTTRECIDFDPNS
jgi:hypothetical protein